MEEAVLHSNGCTGAYNAKQTYTVIYRLVIKLHCVQNKREKK